MKTRPIIFNGEMVREILAGRKTQTRRIIKVSKRYINPDLWQQVQPHSGGGFKSTTGIKSVDIMETCLTGFFCPYGVPGDQLWVREKISHAGLNLPAYYCADGKAVFKDGRIVMLKKITTPSIHMPRWACRIKLDIVDVTVERLNEITREDAKAEGFLPGANGLERTHRGRLCGNAQIAFQETWKEIYGKNAWDKNPWVWVIEFRRIME